MPSIESGADHGVSMWYSYNVGPVHFVVVSTETDFLGASSGHFARSSGDGVGNGGFGDQLAWLEEVCTISPRYCRTLTQCFSWR